MSYDHHSERFVYEKTTYVHFNNYYSFLKKIQSINTFVSPGDMCLYGPLSSSSGWVLCVRTMFTFPGMIMLKTCFPVHIGLGLRIAGCGILPSQSIIHIIRFIIVS